MAKPITPQFTANEAVLQHLTVRYNQAWNGSDWILDPTTIEVLGVGRLAGAGGAEVTQVDIAMMASDLPAAGQTAMQELFNYVETELANKFT